MNNTDFVVDKPNLEVRTSRVFNVTPERLWQACTDPEQVAKWWGPAEYNTVIEKDEVRVGGTWRYVQTGADGQKFGFRGEYLEVDEPNKVVRTFEFELMAGHILTETATFEPQADGTTLYTAVAKYANIEDLEGMVATGMEGGQRESLDRLKALVEAA